MRLRTLIFAVTSAAMLPALAVDPQTGTGESDGYHLVWQDLFDSGTLDELRWNIEENGAGGGNNELQYYTARSENVRVGDDGCGNSCLILTARREAYRNRAFTSGRVNTKNFVAFTHGKIEAAIKLPVTANGLWPAFWMMGNDYDAVGWPKCGETDIMEFGNATGISTGFQDRYFNGACHWGQSWPAASYANSVTRSYSLQDGEFHIFTCYWDDQEVRMYVDLDKTPLQTPYFRMTMPCDDPGNEWSPGNYFHKLNFILFNLAIGGDFTGIHNASDVTALNDANSQQASMYINYVKVYQKDGVPGNDLYMVIPGDEAALEQIDADPAITIDGDRVTLESEADMTLHDISGRLVKNLHARILDLSGLPTGLYILRVVDEDGRAHTMKINR